MKPLPPALTDVLAGNSGTKWTNKEVSAQHSRWRLGDNWGARLSNRRVQREMSSLMINYITGFFGG